MHLPSRVSVRAALFLLAVLAYFSACDKSASPPNVTQSNKKVGPPPRDKAQALSPVLHEQPAGACPTVIQWNSVLADGEDPSFRDEPTQWGWSADGKVFALCYEPSGTGCHTCQFVGRGEETERVSTEGSNQSEATLYGSGCSQEKLAVLQARFKKREICQTGATWPVQRPEIEFILAEGAPPRLIARAKYEPGSEVIIRLTTPLGLESHVDVHSLSPGRDQVALVVHHFSGEFTDIFDVLLLDVQDIDRELRRDGKSLPSNQTSTSLLSTASCSGLGDCPRGYICDGSVCKEAECHPESCDGALVERICPPGSRCEFEDGRSLYHGSGYCSPCAPENHCDEHARHARVDDKACRFCNPRYPGCDKSPQ